MVEKTKQNSIVPLGNRVLIEEIDIKEKTTLAGIIIPESADKDHEMRQGKVISVGEGKIIDGKRISMTVKKGDVVLYSWGDNIKINNKKYIIVSEDNISAIIN
jgi:chaperonin GroES